jgi:O-methyltransferase domain/Dimerisation domain
LLATILEHNPHLRDILFDLPNVIEDARELVNDSGVVDRCKFVSGNFFEAVPDGGDAYILRNIIHDWEDDQNVARSTTRWNSGVGLKSRPCVTNKGMAGNSPVHARLVAASYDFSRMDLVVDIDSAQIQGRDPTGREPSGDAAESRERLWTLIRGYRISQAVYVATRLGIPDLLAGGPRDIEELAQETDSHPPSLRRVLLALAAAGVLNKVGQSRSALTPVGVSLCTGVPGSVR